MDGEAATWGFRTTEENRFDKRRRAVTGLVRPEQYSLVSIEFKRPVNSFLNLPGAISRLKA
jgi:hypothetical protein